MRYGVGVEFSPNPKLLSLAARKNGKNTFIVGQRTIELESGMSVPRVRLYVKSAKTVTGNVEVDLGYVEIEGAYTSHILGEQGEHSKWAPRHPLNVKTGPKEEYMLPEDQERTAEMVKSIASMYGLEVEVVDVARKNILRRAVEEEREKIKAFSALLADSGERIEGDITEEQAARQQVTIRRFSMIHLFSSMPREMRHVSVSFFQILH